MVKGTHCRTESWGVITTQRFQGSIGKMFPEPRETGSHWAKGPPNRSCGLWLRYTAHWKWDTVEREPNVADRGQGKLPRSRKISLQGAERMKVGGKTSKGEKTHPRFCSV